MVEPLLAAFRPPIDPRLTALVITAIVLLWVWRYGRQRRLSRAETISLAALRLVTFAVLTWILIGPVVFKKIAAHPQRRVGLTILADTSASMQARDVAAPAGPVSRFDAMRLYWLNRRAIDKLRRVARVSVKTFAERTAAVDLGELASLTPNGQATDLFAALRGAAGEGQHAAVLLLSDGHDTRRPWDQTVINQLTRQHDRVFAVPVGKPAPQGSVRLAAWADANVVMVGDRTAIHVTVTQRSLSDAKVRLALELAGQKVATRTVAFGKQVAQSVTFDVQPPPASKTRQTTCDYIVRASLVGHQASRGAGQVSPHQHVFITVSPHPLRVLLLEGQPYWDTRELARILRADAGVKLTAVYQLGQRRIVIDPTSKAAGHRLSLDADHLAKFDVVVLGKSINRFFPGKKANELAQYVSRGGALVFARGEPWGAGSTRAFRDAVAPLLPVDWGRRVERQLRLSLTPAGEDNPLMKLSQTRSAHAVLSALPEMLAATRVTRTRSASVVMLDQTAFGSSKAPMAAIAQLRVGSGQVLAVLTEGLWRWRLLPDGQGGLDDALSIFWSRAVRWLAAGSGLVPGQAVTLTVDRARIEPGQSITARIIPRYPVGDRFDPVITVTSPGGKAAKVKPARDRRTARDFIARIAAPRTGIYTLSLDPDSLPAGMPRQVAPAHVVVAPRSVEQLDTAAEPQILEKIARETRGQMLPVAGLNQLFDQLAAINQARASEAIPRDDFAKPWALVTIFFALGIEWWLRRRWGLA